MNLHTRCWETSTVKFSLTIISRFLETTTLSKTVFKETNFPVGELILHKSSDPIAYFWSQKHYQTSKHQNTSHIKHWNKWELYILKDRLIKTGKIMMDPLIPVQSYGWLEPIPAAQDVRLKPDLGRTVFHSKTHSHTPTCTHAGIM